MAELTLKALQVSVENARNADIEASVWICALLSGPDQDTRTFGCCYRKVRMLSLRFLSRSTRLCPKTRTITIPKSSMSTANNGNGNGENGENKPPLLALPATAEETVQQVGLNDTYKLKELGPVGEYNAKKYSLFSDMDNELFFYNSCQRGWNIEPNQ